MSNRIPALRTATARLWHWLIPEPLRHPPERRQQAHRVLALCLAMSVWVPVFAAVYLALGAPTCASIILLAGALLGGIPLLQRATLSPTLAGNMLALLGTATYTGLALRTGGHNSPASLWFVSVPIMAVVLTGPRWGVFWTAVTVAIIGGLYAACELGHQLPVEFGDQGLRLLQFIGLAGLLVCVGALVLVIGTVEDRHHRALERAVHLATAADRAKSEFLANMSHEIRTPMTAILGFTEVLLEGGGSRKPLDDATSREALDTIQRNGHHLLAIINDILDLSKIEAGKLEIERVWAAPLQIVDEVVELMRVRVEAKNLRIDARLEDALPDTIETDPTRLRQVLLNLLGNAIKFTETGAVRLTTRWRPTSQDRGVLEFEIIDTGIGMSEEQIGRLFQPFSQADSSTTRRFGGTGLGLSISQRLTEMLGGSIEVRSRLGEGSTFTVRLPVAIAPALVAEPSLAPALVAGRAGQDVRARSAPVALIPPAARSAPPDGRPQAPSPDVLPAIAGADELQPLSGCRILLAEDSVDNQRLIGHLLRRAGAELTVAADGQRAVEAVHDARQCCQPFDVILMDMQMPILGGCEATRRLRADGYQRPIVALTALSNVGEHRNCREAGCDDVATKPIDRAALISVIQRQLERNVGFRVQGSGLR